MASENSQNGFSGILELERAIQLIRSQGISSPPRRRERDEPISPGDVSRIGINDVTRPVRFRGLHPNSPNDFLTRRDSPSFALESIDDVSEHLFDLEVTPSSTSIYSPRRRFSTNHHHDSEDDNLTTLILLREYIGAYHPDSLRNDVTNADDRSILGITGEQPTQLETSFKHKLRKLRTFTIKDFEVPGSSFIRPGATFHGTHTNVLHASRSSNYENQQSYSIKLEIHSVNKHDSTFYGSMYSKETALLVDEEERETSTQDSSQLDASTKDTTGEGTSRRSLHGEMIDFKHNSWRTENGPANILRDIYFWHSLAPFSTTNYYRFLTNALAEDFIRGVYDDYMLLRWTITDDEDTATDDRLKSAPCTNIRYYYVSLNRMNGHMEGYYADRGNQTPSQLIALNPSDPMAFPVYSLR